MAGTYGTFTLAVNGDWTYSADNTQSAIQSLAAGATLNDSFTATSFDGSASQTVTVTITGTNDVPVIGGVATGGVAEDADPTTLTTGGSLTITDTDNGELSFVAQASVAGTYGTFTLAANGDWTYSADNTQSAIQSLAAGATLNDSFTATSFDGSESQTVTVTITGTNDVPVIGTADNSGAVTELPNNDPGENSADRTDTGTITFTDVDLTDIHTVSVSDNGSGYRGALTAQVTTAATGGGTGEVTWTFTVNDADLDDLGPSDTLNQSYDVTVSDGNGGTKTETVTVTITGAADNTAPIADAQTLSADEDTPLNGTVTATDPDPDSQTYALVANSATNGSVTSFDANTGAFTFTPDADFSGVASFQFTAFDGSETSGPATVTIDVAPVADAPTLEVGPTIRPLIYFKATGNNATDGDVGQELYVHDVLAGTITLVADSTGNAGSTPNFYTVLDGKLYGTALGNNATDGNVGYEFYVHDPLAGTTSLLEELYPGSGNSTPYLVGSVNGQLVVSAYVNNAEFGNIGRELLLYDPESADYMLTADLNEGTGSSYPSVLAVLDGRVYLARPAIMRPMAMLA